MEWKRSYVASYVHPIKKEAAKEYIVLKWDPSSSGGIASYFQLDDNHVVSLIGHVSKKWMNNWFRDQQRKIIILKLRSIQLQHVRVKIMRYSIHQNKVVVYVYYFHCLFKQIQNNYYSDKWEAAFFNQMGN